MNTYRNNDSRFREKDKLVVQITSPLAGFFDGFFRTAATNEHTKDKQRVECRMNMIRFVDKVYLLLNIEVSQHVATAISNFLPLVTLSTKRLPYEK